MLIAILKRPADLFLSTTLSPRKVYIPFLSRHVPSIRPVYILGLCLIDLLSSASKYIQSFPTLQLSLYQSLHLSSSQYMEVSWRNYHQTFTSFISYHPFSMANSRITIDLKIRFQFQQLFSPENQTSISNYKLNSSPPFSSPFELIHLQVLDQLLTPPPWKKGSSIVVYSI